MFEIVASSSLPRLQRCTGRHAARASGLQQMGHFGSGASRSFAVHATHATTWLHVAKNTPLGASMHSMHCADTSCSDSAVSAVVAGGGGGGGAGCCGIGSGMGTCHDGGGTSGAGGSQDDAASGHGGGAGAIGGSYGRGAAV